MGVVYGSLHPYNFSDSFFSFNFFTLCKKYVFCDYEFTGNHLPNKAQLPQLERYYLLIHSDYGGWRVEYRENGEEGGGGGWRRETEDFQIFFDEKKDLITIGAFKKVRQAHWRFCCKKFVVICLLKVFMSFIFDVCTIYEQFMR